MPMVHPPKPIPQPKPRPEVSDPKVYCENCEYYIASAMIEKSCVATSKPVMTEDTWLRKGVCTGYRDQADPRERNKDNNCKFFRGNIPPQNRMLVIDRHQ